MVAISAAESAEALEGSIFALIIADIRSSGETFIEPEDEDEGSICYRKLKNRKCKRQMEEKLEAEEISDRL